MGERSSSGADRTTMIVWTVTGLLALLILGICVFVAVNRKHAEPPRQTTKSVEVEAEVMPQVAPPPVNSYQPPDDESPVVEQPQEETPPPAVVRPPPASQEGAAVLKLDSLAGTLKLEIPFLALRDKMPLEYTCYRNNSSPEMKWQGAPPGTMSYVVFLERRTPATESPYENWILFNIPAGTDGLQEDLSKDANLPGGARHATADSGTLGYNGPCEPTGKYTYALRVFALDAVLPVPAGTAKDDLIRAMNGHIIDAAEKEFIHYRRL